MSSTHPIRIGTCFKTQYTLYESHLVMCHSRLVFLVFLSFSSYVWIDSNYVTFSQ